MGRHGNTLPKGHGGVRTKPQQPKPRHQDNGGKKSGK